MTSRILLGTALGLIISSAALAQSYTAPAGIPAATAPGGLDGQAASRNVAEYTGRYSRPVRGQTDADYTTGSVKGTPSQPGR